MNFWCRILGHTWTPDTTASDAHWHTTKKGFVLEFQGAQDGVSYFDRCIRCDERREVAQPAAARRDDEARAAAEEAAEQAAAADGEDKPADESAA